MGISIGNYLGFDKILPFYQQLTQDRLGNQTPLQPLAQKDAHYVGPQKCKKCHEENYKHVANSMHSKMIQDIKKNPAAVVANFSTLPADANFALKDAVYTIGSKFKQRFMIPKDFNGTADYVLGNYQWNVETQKWQGFKPWKYWYKDAYPHDNAELPTSNACDGCHFTGYMSQKKRVEPAVSCESCHGPGSEHVANPESKVYMALTSDPIRQNEVCFQCHMRNRDKRLDDHNMSEIFGTAVDYPAGYEPGMPLARYKKMAPFTPGVQTKEFWANGSARKNRTQGNEFVHSIKGQHGITCINCHSPHSLSNTAQNNEGNDLCMKCHSFGSPIGPHQNDLSAHTRHKENSKGSKCVECHMPKTAKHTGKSPLTVRSHLFGFTTPQETLKYKMPKETNACYSCHQDKTLGALQNDLEKWGMVNWENRD